MTDWASVPERVLWREALYGGDDEAALEILDRYSPGMDDVSRQLTRMYQPRPDEDPMTATAAERYSSSEPRDYHGRWTTGGPKGGAAVADREFEPITRDQLSNPDTPRTREVSQAEFDQLAAEGRDRLAQFHRDGGAPKGLDDNWARVKDDGWASVQDEWGGATVDAHTGKSLAADADVYALTVKAKGQESVRIPIGSSREEFDAAMDEARGRFDAQFQSTHSNLGIFRDEDLNSIDIDPVLVVDNLHDVETIGSFARAIGGAYRPKDGNGYWPPYVRG